LGVSGDSTTNNAEIVLRTGPLTDGMRWKIKKTSSHAFKLIPLVGEAYNRALSVSWHSVNTDGIALEQRSYTGDDVYDDEWFVHSFLNVGFSTDDYDSEECGNKHRNSYRYANKFFQRLTASTMGTISRVHRYNYLGVVNASKQDFSNNGTFSNDIDFMIYIGHGHTAHGFDNGTVYAENHIHYDCGYIGEPHTDTSCNVASNLYLHEVTFGSSSSDLRWVWMYTCNFLRSSDEDDSYTYVTNTELVTKMSGAHIVMGYASQSYLCDAMAETFGDYLRQGETIFRAYFLAGHNGEATATQSEHIQKIMYIPQAEHETIYSVEMQYDYDESDVCIYTHNIQMGFPN
jgi:hypothetical protein